MADDDAENNNKTRAKITTTTTTLLSRFADVAAERTQHEFTFNNGEEGIDVHTRTVGEGANDDDDQYDDQYADETET